MVNYQTKKELYKPEKLFDTLHVNLNITDTNYDGNLIYLLENIVIDNDNHDSNLINNFQQNLVKILGGFNVAQSYTPEHRSWSIFYAFKEMIDQILKCTPEGYKAYFRGQSGNWPLQPTIFRDGEGGYSKDFRENYEHIYKSISQKFPEDVTYHSLKESMDDRATNLAELQHYGLGTPLVDISENPFISLLFMVDGYHGDGNEPQLDVFFAKDNGKNILFQQVIKRDQNRRIGAQKGAFLNFDLWKIDENDIERIPRITISIKYVTDSLSDTEISDLPDEKNIISTDEADFKRKKVLITAVNDIKSKLSSFFYNTEDLFPDFYMYLGVLKNKYADINKNKDNKWYQVNIKKDIH